MTVPRIVPRKDWAETAAATRQHRPGAPTATNRGRAGRVPRPVVTGTFACSSSSASRRSPGRRPTAELRRGCRRSAPAACNRKQTTADDTFYNFLLPAVNLLFLAAPLEDVPRSPLRCSREDAPLTRRSAGWRVPAAGARGASPAAAGGAAPAARPAERPNVLLVTIDTLRADRVGCYGYARGRRPRRSTPWPPAASASRRPSPTCPLTGPSHASILTGPARRSATASARTAASSCRPQVAVRGRGLPAGGLPHGGVRLGFPLDRRFGFDRGFETYDDHLPKGNDPRRTPYVERFADAHHRRRAALARRDPAAGAPRALLPLGPLLRPARAVRAARASSPRASAPRPTTARWRSSDRSSGGCSGALEERGALAPHARASRCPTTARASASTARAPTASSSTTRRSRCPFIVAGPGVAGGRVAPTVARGDRRAADAPRLRRPRRGGPRSRAARSARRSRGGR